MTQARSSAASNDPVRVLMAAHPSVGHTAALRAIGARLVEQGHSVSMALVRVRLPFLQRWPEMIRVAATIPDQLARDGITWLPLSASLEAFWHGARIAKKTGHEELAVAIDLFTVGTESQAKQIASYARETRADVIVADFLMPAAMLAAQITGLPHVAIYHSALPFPVEGAAPFGSGLSDDERDSPVGRRALDSLLSLERRVQDRLASACSNLGLPPFRHKLLTEPVALDLTLLPTTPDLEPNLLPIAGAETGKVVMTGPCLPKIAPSSADDPALNVLPRDASSGLRVYVSLGTVFNDQPEVFEAILDGLASLDAHVVVSAGASYERIVGRANARTHVFRRVPQVALLRTVDLVITHGGNNTVQECLASGCAMVVVPFGGDQLENSRRIERLGVGVAVRASPRMANAVRAAVERAGSPEFISRAKALASKLDGVDGTAIAADAVVKLARDRRDGTRNKRGATNTTSST